MSQEYQSSRRERNQISSLALICTQVFLALFGLTAIIGGGMALFTAMAPHKTAHVVQAAAIQEHVQAHLDIVMDQPGMQKDWPAYAPNTLTVPANSLVTITLRNYDLGDTPLPANSPFLAVQGTVNSVATTQGQTFRTLAAEKVAHTFSIPQLNLNVPIPGDAPAGAAYTSVTFTFHTGKAGTYTFQCFDPCGTGSSGWMGPMSSKGYMMGTLVVQ